MMHRIIRDHLEEVLAGPGSAPKHPAGEHLAACAECREQVAAMREQAAALRQFHVESEPEPRPGFYARVMDRIEAQAPLSVWTLFFDSMFGRRIALASLALALLIGVYVISSEQMPDPEVAAVDGLPPAGLVTNLTPNGVTDLPQDFVFSGQPRQTAGAPDQDAVLVNLVTYREQ
jgi:predicted anti-sigma-YlaC factor YlaD